MKRGDTDRVLDDQGARQLVDSLYGLPHFGEDLKRIVQNNNQAVDAAFREKTFNVSAGTHWTSEKRRARKRWGTQPRAHQWHISQPSQPSGSQAIDSQGHRLADHQPVVAATDHQTEPQPSTHAVETGIIRSLVSAVVPRIFHRHPSTQPRKGWWLF